MKSTLPLAILMLASPALADGNRQLDAHEHGVGELQIAIEGTTVAMALHAPGADIVGFEHVAESDADKAAIAAALETLSAPLTLFAPPDAAGCTVTEVEAELEGEAHHEEHHEDEDHGDEEHEEHHEDGHDDAHDEHHDEHHEEAHEEHHDEHHGDDADGHTEFHAEYELTCTDPDALDTITFAYFEAFPNAREVEVQIVTAQGAAAYEVERDAPVLKLGR